MNVFGHSQAVRLIFHLGNDSPVLHAEQLKKLTLTLLPCVPYARWALRKLYCGAIAGSLVGIPCVALSAPMPSSFDLMQLDGRVGFVLNGIDFNDVSGLSVSAAGDVNNDGIDDLIIGARAADPNDNVESGESYVVFGSSGVGSAGNIELSSLDGSNGFILNGVNTSDLSGSSVSAGGDINGDGVDDLIIGAPFADPNGQSGAGESYVVFGGSGVGGSGVVELSSLNGSNGFLINGVDSNDNSGLTLSSAGDVNDDGADDLIISALSADPSGNVDAGESYVVFGGSQVGVGGGIQLSDLDGSNGFVINGLDAGDRLGVSVSLAGDINGDNVDDLIIGASRNDANNIVDAGASYVLFGGAIIGSTGAVDLSVLDGNNGFVVNGVDTNDFSGISVSSAGDVNGDGVGDLLIGASGAGVDNLNSVGNSYVVFGAVGVGSSGILELSSLDGSNGFLVNGVDSGDMSGGSVSEAGDINNDGFFDFIIGASAADPGGRSRAGKSYVVLGSGDIGFSGTVNLSSLDGSSGFVLNGIDANDFSGRSVSDAGDINGDGIGDLIIGADRATSTSGQSNAGESYVVFMPLPDTAEPNDEPADATFISLGQTLSHSIAPVGDLDRFVFVLAQSEQVTIDTFNDGTVQDFDTVLEVFDAAGTSLAFNDDGGGTPYSQILLELDAGEYQIQVSSSLVGSVIPSYSVSLDVASQLCMGQSVTVNMQDGDVPTSGNDVILGTTGDDFINALSGDDLVCSGAGNDTVLGGSGNDMLDGGNGLDVINGQSGDDILYGRGGSDFLTGGTGRDTIIGGVGNDDIRGEGGNDTLLGQGGNDTMDGGLGIDGINGGPGDDIIFTGAGATVGTGVFVSGDGGSDTITGGSQNDDLRGGPGADIINGESGNDQISGGLGQDILSGGDGNDDLSGEGSRDTLIGGAGDDTLDGGNETDVLNGDAGNDELIGGPGNDVLSGNDGNDVLLGGNGNDALSGGANADTCNGENGTDTADNSCENVINVP